MLVSSRCAESMDTRLCKLVVQSIQQPHYGTGKTGYGECPIVDGACNVEVKGIIPKVRWIKSLQ